MHGGLRHHAHDWSDRLNHSIESAFFTAGALLVFLALLVFYLGLLAVKR
jgi:hypothetical protein